MFERRAGGSRRLLAAVTAVSAAALAGGTAVAAHASSGHAAASGAAASRWTGSWSAAPSGVSGAFANETLREVVRSSIGGNEIRVRLTDALSSAPLTVDDVTVALRANGAAVTSARPVTFSGSRATTLPPGAEMLSDPVALDVGAGQDIAVSVYINAPVQDVTQHFFANTTSYLASGDHTADTDGTAFTRTTTSWYMLDGLDVRTSCQHGAVVAFGDSITDGVHSTVDANATWPSDLARRLAARGSCQPAVLNEGIDGNRVLTGSVPGEARFERDVLAQTGARTVIFLDGINDIGHDLNAAGGMLTAAELIDGITAMVTEAREKGLRVIGGTLLPIGGSKYDTSAAEAMLATVNQWIRTSGEFDAVIDFNHVVSDPSDPAQMLSAFNSGDSLHPDDAGYQAMADAINLNLLEGRR